MTKKLNQQSKQPGKRIYIVEDHPVFREGLRQIVNREIDLSVCGEAGNVDEALQGILQLKPDLALVDISLPGKSGLDLIRKLRTKVNPVRLLILSMHDEALYADRVLRAGGDGYIMKQEDPEEIVHAIRDVLAGHIYISEDVLAEQTAAKSRKAQAGSKRDSLDKLTDAELEIMELLGRGRSSAQITKQLGLSAKAVATHCSRMRTKLKLKSDELLKRFAASWIESDD